MTVVSSKEFVSNQKRYFGLAMKEDVCIEDGENRFHLMYNSIKEPHTQERVYYEPDEDFYRSITADEFKEGALRIIDKIFASK